MSKTTKIEIEVPEGKRAEWVNGVLTLIDEKPKDVTERIKTFQDASDELGADDELVKEYRALGDNARLDTVCWLRLGIIVKALNEGWTPKFDKQEYRYVPYFYLYTNDEISEMTDEEKSRVVYRSPTMRMRMAALRTRVRLAVRRTRMRMLARVLPCVRGNSLYMPASSLQRNTYN